MVNEHCRDGSLLTSNAHIPILDCRFGLNSYSVNKFNIWVVLSSISLKPRCLRWHVVVNTGQLEDGLSCASFIWLLFMTEFVPTCQNPPQNHLDLLNFVSLIGPIPVLPFFKAFTITHIPVLQHFRNLCDNLKKRHLFPWWFHIICYVCLCYTGTVSGHTRSG